VLPIAFSLVSSTCFHGAAQFPSFPRLIPTLLCVRLPDSAAPVMQIPRQRFPPPLCYRIFFVKARPTLPFHSVMDYLGHFFELVFPFIRRSGFLWQVFYGLLAGRNLSSYLGSLSLSTLLSYWRQGVLDSVPPRSASLLCSECCIGRLQPLPLPHQGLSLFWFTPIISPFHS